MISESFAFSTTSRLHEWYIACNFVIINFMENKRNYQRELEKIIENTEKQLKDCSYSDSDNMIPSLFIHACCAPCSSYCLEYLCKYFRITVFYYNPNITFEAEYVHRVEEEKRLIAEYNQEMKAGSREGYEIDVVEGKYDPENFYAMAKGLEMVPEGGERCFKCFELRLRETFEEAKRQMAGGRKIDYITTTLTISPLKNAVKLNEIGEAMQDEYGVKWLPSDFKKKNGYKRSIELSAEYDLYRQDFCGCVYSKVERDRDKQKDL